MRRQNSKKAKEKPRGTLLYLTFKTAPGLPEVAAGRLPISGPIFIMRGESYYYQAAEWVDPDLWNEVNGITKVQARCMFWGILAGWHVPGANPENYDEDGEFVGSKIKAHTG
jgi:hypothetical protein